MAEYSLAQKAHDMTEATALASESPRRWANVFAHVYCALLADADRAKREDESRIVGLEIPGIDRLAALGGESDDECLAEAIRVFGACELSPLDAEGWFARVRSVLGTDDEGRTVLEP
jgi:hypothetical protein